MLKRFRPLVERVPALANSYRVLRDTITFQTRQLESTRDGVSLIAPPGVLRNFDSLDETAILKDWLRRTEVFVDIGANIGFYTTLARSLGRPTLAIEPLADNLRYLYSNLLQNGFEDVEVYPLGLGARPGLAELFGARTGASMISGWANASRLLRRTIPVLTLDVILGDRFRGQRLLIKIDVEGTEYDVLRGALATLERQPNPVWLVEICLTELHPSGMNEHFCEIFEQFWSHDYEARSANGQYRLVVPDDVRRWARLGRREFGTTNYVFLPKELSVQMGR